jgi:hypothetical protein
MLAVHGRASSLTGLYTCGHDLEPCPLRDRLTVSDSGRVVLGSCVADTGRRQRSGSRHGSVNSPRVRGILVRRSFCPGACLPAHAGARHSLVCCRCAALCSYRLRASRCTVCSGGACVL